MIIKNEEILFKNLNKLIIQKKLVYKNNVKYYLKNYVKHKMN